MKYTFAKFTTLHNYIFHIYIYIFNVYVYNNKYYLYIYLVFKYYIFVYCNIYHPPERAVDQIKDCSCNLLCSATFLHGQDDSSIIFSLLWMPWQFVAVGIKHKLLQQLLVHHCHLSRYSTLE